MISAGEIGCNHVHESLLSEGEGQFGRCLDLLGTKGISGNDLND